MFRTATVRDVPFIADLIRRFYVGKDFEVTYGIPFDYGSTQDTILAVIERGVAILGNKSCAGAMIAPFPYNHAEKVGYVQFWYFESHKEIRIFAELLKRLKAAGAHHVWATCHPPHFRTSRVYCAAGLKAVEAVWGARV